MIKILHKDIAGLWHVTWQSESGTYMRFTFDHEPSENECLAKESKWIDEHEYDDEPFVSFNISEDISIIRDFVVDIRNNPTVTLVQFENYLSNKSFYEETAIKYFMYKLAIFLADIHGITLSSYTKSEIFTNVRDWLVSQPIKKIKKIVFGLNSGAYDVD